MKKNPQFWKIELTEVSVKNAYFIFIIAFYKFENLKKLNPFYSQNLRVIIVFCAIKNGSKPA